MPQPVPAGDWATAVGRLLGPDEPAPSATAETERLGLTLLARGDFLNLLAGVVSIPPERRSLLLEVLHADMRVRAHMATLHELEMLRDRVVAVHAQEGPDYRWWEAAIRSEFLSWQSDPFAYELAAEALASMPDEAMPSAPTLVARGRLRRIHAMGQLFTWDASGPQQAWDMLELAIADLTRAGWIAERAFTKTWFAVVWGVLSFDDHERCRAMLEDASRNLEDLESPFAPLSYLALALICLIAGDVSGMHEAIARASTTGTPMFGELDRYAPFLQNLTSLIGSGGGRVAVNALEAQAGAVEPVGPGAAGSIALSIASVLADFGDTRGAQRWLNRSRDLPALSPYGSLHLNALDARVRVLDGEAQALADLVAVADTYVRVGLRRFGGIVLIRAARDLERVGRDADAASCRERGVALLPARRRWTVWESLWAMPLAPAAAVAEAAATNALAAPPSTRWELRLLAPDLELRSGGAVVRLPSACARLVAVLACASRPLAAEEVVDRLWPDADAASGRNRLNVTLHRLRKALGPDAGTLVRREGDRFTFDPGGVCSVDVVDFLAHATGLPGERRRALVRYESDLCVRQFGYDDALAEERRRLHARWIDCAMSLLDDPDEDPAPIADAAQRIQVDSPQLIELIARRLEEHGRGAEAAALRL